jgi:hypothetical protein
MPRNHHPLPPRCWRATGSLDDRGKPLFASSPWTESDIIRALAAGGRFNFPATQFADRATALFAGQAQATFMELRT